VALAAAGAAAWTQRHRWLPHEDPAGPPARDAHGPPDLQSVTLSEEAVRGLGLKAAPVTVRDYPKVVEVPGVVIDPPGVSDRAVSAPVAGVVAEVHALPGDTVRAGDPLFTIHLTSELVQSAQTDLARVTKDLVAAVARRDQTKKLVEAGTKPGMDLIEDENQVRRLTTQAQGYRRQLQVFGLTPDQVRQAETGDFVTRVVVGVPGDGPPLIPAPGGGSAPLAFEMEGLAVTPGQGVTGGQLLARLANHRELLIEGRAFESEAPLVAAATRDGKPVGVDLLEAVPGEWEPVEQRFVIRSVGNSLDPATRTFPFFVPLANQARSYQRGGKTYLSWRFRPGQKVRLQVPVGVIPGVIVLPAAAVVREGADSFVFRQNGEAYDRKSVVVAAEDRLTVAITPGNGIEDGVMVLQNNAAAVNRALKAAQLRASGGSGGRKGH
jgi:multidrug efflux pump subunit AcrA (membrane-fusion protein)